MRTSLTPRLVDASLLVGICLAFATGVGTLFVGTSRAAWVVVLHGVAGLCLLPLLGWKLRRVRPRLRPSRWESRTVVSVLALLAALGALATGLFRASGGTVSVAAWNGLMVHVVLGLLLGPLLAGHLRGRFRTPTRRDVEGRRTALQYALLVGGGVLAWRLQRAAVAALGLFPSRRFTGSRERGTAPGNTFPVTVWIADDPDPVDVGTWTLRVEGAVAAGRTFDYAALVAAADEHRATLDCTSGWYTTQDWRGVRVSRLLDAVDPDGDAAWVTFRSVTGYRWSLPIEEARTALLATHVGGDPLTHGHGFPIRLVAPGRRGFQWVKWIDAVEVRRDPDYGQWLAIFTSGFETDT